MQTQCNRLLAHLKQHGEIEPLTALSDLGIYRLGARIFDLRKQGHNITSNRVELQNRFGEPCRVARYRLD